MQTHSIQFSECREFWFWGRLYEEQKKEEEEETEEGSKKDGRKEASKEEEKWLTGGRCLH